jgi:pyridoxine/pyridoxamine 5'-phosphate oxidase
MDWSAIPLEAFPETLFRRLGTAVREINDPLRTPALATSSGNTPHVRTVVLREVNFAQRTLTAFSDSRAGKVAELTQCHSAEWLFYEAAGKFQIRAHGRTRLHRDNDQTRRRWGNVPLANRVNYCTAVAPGTALPSVAAAFPETLRGQTPTPENTAAGEKHFAVLVTEVETLDWLWLRADGHWRAQFHWTNGAWRGSWVAP